MNITCPVRSYIASDNLDTPECLQSEIIDTCQRLAERPDLGHFRRDLTDKPVRFFALRSTYLIMYDSTSEPLEVLRLLHGSRDVTAQLAPEDS